MTEQLRTPPFEYNGDQVVELDEVEDCTDQCLLHEPSCDGYCDHVKHINQCLIFGDARESSKQDAPTQPFQAQLGMMVDYIKFALEALADEHESNFRYYVNEVQARANNLAAQVADM